MTVKHMNNNNEYNKNNKSLKNKQVPNIIKTITSLKLINIYFQ